MLEPQKSFKKPNRFATQEFTVIHYAGEVVYDINGFIEKNRDTLSDFITETLSGS